MNNIQYPLDGASGWGESVRSNFHKFEDNIDDLNLNKTNILNTIGNAELQTTDKTVKGAINENTTQLKEKANKTNAEFEGNMKLNNVDVATNITSNIILQNGWVKLEDTAALKLCKTGNQISAILHIKGGVITGGTVICNLGCTFDHYQNFIAYRYDGLVLGTVTLNKNGNVNVTTLSSNEDVFINITDICE